MRTGLPEGMVTPALVVDVDGMERNISRLAAAARAGGFAVRPRAKAHKCLEIADRQIGAGAAGLTVATVGEAEVFARGGATDLFIAYPLWVDDSKARRLRRLAEAVRGPWLEYLRRCRGRDESPGAGTVTSRSRGRVRCEAASFGVGGRGRGVSKSPQALESAGRGCAGVGTGPSRTQRSSGWTG